MQLQRLQHTLQKPCPVGDTFERLIHDICKAKQTVASCNIMSLEAVQSALS